MTNLQVGLIGCGRWGRNIARVLAARDELTAIAARRPNRIAEVAAAYGVPGLTPEALLARPDIEAVAIATDPVAHPELVMAALAAGKAVFVEKPLALDGASARACAGAAQKAGLPLMVGHTMLHHPAFRRLAALVEAGAIGPVRQVRSQRFVTRPAAPGESALWLLAPHDVSMTLALGGPPLVAAGGQADGRWRLTLDLAENVTADIRVGMGAVAKRSRLEVVGDEGALIFDDTAPTAKKLALAMHRNRQAAYLEAETTEPLAAEMAWFADVVRGKRPPMSSGIEAVAVIETLERCQARPMEE